MRDNWKISAMLSLMLVGAGFGYYYVEDELPKHPEKEYKFRSLEGEFEIFTHHSATEDQSLEQMAEYHISKGWGGIAYHFAVIENGDVKQTESLNKITYHTKGHNTKGISIMLVGNFQEREVPDIMIESVECLIQGLEQSLNIVGVGGHRNVRNTLCPGDYATEQLKHLYY